MSRGAMVYWFWRMAPSGDDSNTTSHSREGACVFHRFSSLARGERRTNEFGRGRICGGIGEEITDASPTNGAARAQQDTPPLRGREWLGVVGLGLLRFLLVQPTQVGDQFAFARPALEVQAQHLEGSLRRLVTRPLPHAQAGDQSARDRQL